MLRFDIMLYLVDMTNMSVLDVGCGDGALFHYLSDQNINAEYKGIDVSKKWFSELKLVILESMFAMQTFLMSKKNYDVVISSGSLSMCDGDPMDYLSAAIDHLFSVSNSHLVFNLLSDHAPAKSDKFNRYHPASVLDFLF